MTPKYLMNWRAGMPKPLVSAAVLCATFGWGSAAQAQVLVHGAGEQPVEITVLDLQADASRLEPASRTFALSEKARIEGAARGLLVRSTLAQQAKTSGLDQSPIAKKRLEQAQETVLMELLMEDAAQKAFPSDAELLKYAQTVYKNDKDSFTTQGELAASHILIAGDTEESKKKIDALYQQIESGADFGELAFKSSQDPASAAKHGSLGFFPEGKMIAAFEKELKALKLGEISKPFKTEYGWHIARLDGEHPKGQLSFDDVKERLIEEAKNRMLKERRDALVQGVLDHAVVNDEAISKIAAQYQAKANAEGKAK